MPLLRNLNSVPDVLQAWYADDASATEKLV